MKNIKKTNNSVIVKIIKTDSFLVSHLNIEKTIDKFGDLYDNNTNSLLSSNVKSRKMASWKCDKGHEWDDKILKVNNNRECPYCSGKYLLTGINDLKTINPKLAQEWHPILNKDLYPSMVAYRSVDSVWWLCENGHKWKCRIDRRNNGVDCPYCKKKEKRELNVYIVYYYIKKYFKEAVLDYRDKNLIRNYKINVYIPSLKIGIEYDEDVGVDVKKSNLDKNNICSKNEIKLIRIRDTCLSSSILNSSSIDYQRYDNNWISLENILKEIFVAQLEIENPIINIEKDLSDIYKNKK